MTIILKPESSDPVTNSVWLLDTHADVVCFFDGGEGREIQIRDENGEYISDYHDWLTALSQCNGKTRDEVDEWIDGHTNVSAKSAWDARGCD